MSQLAEQVVGRLLRQDPREVLGAMLEYVVAMGSSAAAVFDVRDGRPELMAGHRISGSSINWVADAWKQHQKLLERGDTINAPPQSLLPALAGKRLLALLLLEEADLPTGYAAEAAALLANALDDEAHASMASLKQMDSRERERQKLLDLLERHEWNISRVARELGVVRNTVYQRLDKLDIDRQKVPKPIVTRHRRVKPA